MYTSESLEEGKIYTREALQKQFYITDQTLFTGIFRPAGHDSIWLFITEQKSADHTQYIDRLEGGTLSWQGQTQGLKDQLIIEHKVKGLELLVFYRKFKYEYPGAGFRYEGRFEYVSHSGSHPTSFCLERTERVLETGNQDLKAQQAEEEERSTVTPTHPTKTANSARTGAFIGYSHKDARFLSELQTHLAAHARNGDLVFWDDTKISPGAPWKEEISKALETAKVAVLLVSADFLASDYIAEKELPTLLAAAEGEGARILSVIIRPCAFLDTKLAHFQAVNKPSEPVSGMPKVKREELWVKVARLVRDALKA